MANIPGCPGYTASDDTGEILNSRGIVLRQWRESADGAFRVRVCGRNRMVNYLILSAFTGHPPAKGYRPVHLNRDRADNRLENLAWSGRISKREPARTISADFEREYYRVARERLSLAELMQN